uniref:Ferritin n=1 Tax=Conus ermineus TaxID=55423 RepID=A0A346CIP9_CONER|nr:ferritin [Conus ermineus]
MSQVRQNFHEECEAAINRQINLQKYADYVYMSMSFYFDRDDVSLKGFHEFFKKKAHEECGYAEKLMEYQNMRGGRILLQTVKKPDRDDWGSGLEALQAALQLEKSINQSMMELHQCASCHNDPQMSDFVEDNFLKEQVETIKEISDYITNLKRVGTGLGEFIFDKETLQEKQE